MFDSLNKQQIRADLLNLLLLEDKSLIRRSFFDYTVKLNEQLLPLDKEGLLKFLQENNPTRLEVINFLNKDQFQTTDLYKELIKICPEIKEKLKS